MKTIRLSGDLRAAILVVPLATSAVGCISNNATSPGSDDAGGFDATLEDAAFPPGTDSSVPDATTDAPPPADTSTPPPVDAGSDAPTDAAIDAPLDAGPQLGTIVGQVFDFMELDIGPISGASVSIAGGPSTTTDATGRFVLSGVTPGPRVLVDVSVPFGQGVYSSNQVVVAVGSGETVDMTAHLLEGCSTTVAVSPTAAASTTLQGACASRTIAYASISFDPGALTESGSTFSGNALFEVIPIESPASDGGIDYTWFSTFPGDMSAQKLDGGTLPLQSLGACEFRVYDESNGSPLTIAAGHTATLEIPAFRAETGSENFTGYYYDTTTGLWVEQGPGTFTTQTVNSLLVNVFQIQVPHLTWWNIDQGTTNEGCVIGEVTSNGAPFPGLLVGGTGVGWGGGGGGVTGANGTFCLNGLASSPMNVTATAQSGGATFVRGLGTLTTGAAGGSCAVNPSACAVAPPSAIIPLEPITPGCATGTLNYVPTYADGGVVPLPFQYNFPGGGEPGSGQTGSFYDGVITPAPDGSFCLQYPPGVTVAIVDPTSSFGCSGGEPNENAASFTPPAIAADAGAAICPTGCANVGNVDFYCTS
ncbi:MAG: carboxypeptidase-like regulatory domain-containing protein [Polyangiaceae bacterium]